MSIKGGTGGGGWVGSLQGAMHMVAARLGCQSTMVGTGWANSRPGCMDRLRKRYSHLVGGSKQPSLPEMNPLQGEYDPQG